MPFRDRSLATSATGTGQTGPGGDRTSPAAGGITRRSKRVSAESCQSGILTVLQGKCETWWFWLDFAGYSLSFLLRIGQERWVRAVAISGRGARGWGIAVRCSRSVRAGQGIVAEPSWGVGCDSTTGADHAGVCPAIAGGHLCGGDGRACAGSGNRRRSGGPGPVVGRDELPDADVRGSDSPDRRAWGAVFGTARRTSGP